MNDHDFERLINEGEHIVLSVNETLREIASVEHVTLETPDARWTITKEWCGRTRPQFVARFCGDWLGCRETRIDAQGIIDADFAAHQRLIDVPRKRAYPAKLSDRGRKSCAMTLADLGDLL